MSHPDDERKDIILQQPFRRVKHDNKPDSIGSDVDGDDEWSITKVKIKEQPHNQEIHAKITSDGGSSSYYLFPQPLVDLVVKTGKLETKDIIRHGFGNDNDFGNVFKALKRLYELKLGGGKDGSTAGYEVNKMKYFLDEVLEDLK